MSERGKEREETPPAEADTGKPANVAPDAVKDPNEKTDGKPGVPPSQGNETDPGGG